MATNGNARGLGTAGAKDDKETGSIARGPATQDQLAAELYEHPAASALLRSAIHGQTPEERRRASLALAVLDSDTPFAVVEALVAVLARALSGREAAPSPAPLDTISAALRTIVYSTDRRVRLRMAELLGALCRSSETVGHGPLAGVRVVDAAGKVLSWR